LHKTYHFTLSRTVQVEIAKFPTKFIWSGVMESMLLGANGTFFQRNVDISYNYKVRKEGWYNVVFVVCRTAGDNFAVPQLLDQQHAEQDESQEHAVILGMQDGRASNSLLPLVGGPSARQRPASGALVHTLRSAPAAHQDSSSDNNEHRRRLSFKKDVTTTLQGSIAFRNPYGYIPAELFGLLPFQVRTRLRS
jgi:hypothetical protein